MITDDLWKLLQVVAEWTKYADAKAAGVLTASGVLGGCLLQALPKNAAFHIDQAPSLLILIGASSDVAAALLALWSLVPTLRAGEATSSIYFEHIARRFKSSQLSYRTEILDVMRDPDRLAEQLASQVWATSKVARTKFLTSGLSILFIGLAAALLAAAATWTRLR